MMHLGGLVDLLERLLQVAGDRLVVLLLQVGEVLGDDADHDVVVGADVARLDQQALRQDARADADRVELLDALEHLLGQLERDAGLGGQIRRAASSK